MRSPARTVNVVLVACGIPAGFGATFGLLGLAGVRAGHRPAPAVAGRRDGSG